MSDAAVSVVITCYNAEAFIAGAIDSALAQTHPGVEVVVVDDASTDASWEIVRGYGDRITALRLPTNGAAPHARNSGARAARGRWLTFLDSDDYIEPDTVAAMVAAGERAPGAVVVAPWRYLIRDEHGWFSYQAPRPLAPRVDDPLRGWLAGEWAPPCAVMYPREVYERAGGFDEVLRRNDDGDLAMRAFLAGAGVAVAAGGMAVYRRHGATRRSMSTDGDSEVALRSQMRVMDKIRTALEARGRVDAYRDLLAAHYAEIALRAFEAGRFAVGRACLASGGVDAARRLGGATPRGRLAARLLGVAWKCRVAALVRQTRERVASRRAAAVLPAGHSGRAGGTDLTAHGG